MKFTAAYGPHLDGDQTRSGFESRDAAIAYILEHCCSVCREDVLRGYLEIEPPDSDETDRIEVSDALDTSCGAEWFIVSDDDWQKFTENKDFTFLLESAGYTKMEKIDKV